jgi:hypothetical protein
MKIEDNEKLPGINFKSDYGFRIKSGH